LQLTLLQQQALDNKRQQEQAAAAVGSTQQPCNSHDAGGSSARGARQLNCPPAAGAGRPPPLHHRAVLGHVHSLKPAMLRPLQGGLYFFLQLGRHAALERSLQRHDGFLAALLRLGHAQRCDALPVVRLAVVGIKVSGEAGVESSLKTGGGMQGVGGE
jgi:hypothetical protein